MYPLAEFSFYAGFEMCDDKYAAGLFVGNFYYPLSELVEFVSKNKLISQTTAQKLMDDLSSDEPGTPQLWQDALQEMKAKGAR